MLGSLKEIIDTDRPLNNRKARALKGAALFIGLGLLGVARSLSSPVRQIGQEFSERPPRLSGLLIHAPAGTGGGLGARRTNRSGLAA